MNSLESIELLQQIESHLSDLVVIGVFIAGVLFYRLLRHKSD